MDARVAVERLSQLSRDQLLRHWHDEHLRSTVGVGLDDAVGVLDDLRAFEGWMIGTTKRWCEEWRYCERMREHERDVELATALGEYLAQTLGLGMELSLSAAVLIVKQGFDRVCDCS